MKGHIHRLLGITDAVILLGAGGAFGWGCEKPTFPRGGISNQHTSQIHALVTVLIRLGVATGGVGRVNSKIHTVPIHGP